MQLPDDQNRLLASTKQIRPVRRERQRRDRVRMPMQRRRGRALLDRRNVRGRGVVQTVPQSDITLLVARGEIFFRGVEGETGERFGGDEFREAGFEV